MERHVDLEAGVQVLWGRSAEHSNKTIGNMSYKAGNARRGT